MNKQKVLVTGALPLLIALVVLLNTPTAGAKENVIFRFNFKEGSQPQSALISDGKGNLYGTSLGAVCGNGPCGYVYELSPGSGGAWNETVLYAFKGQPDLSWPVSLTFDSKGNLFGAGFRGGTDNVGGIFELTPGANGTWKESIIYSFSDLGDPTGDLAFDSKGNLYGTSGESSSGYGAVYELSPQSNGTWTESTILLFNRTNGYFPAGGVILDSKGNLYGATNQGGSGFGNVFELTPNGDGSWTDNILYTFTEQSGPTTTLTFDRAGNLYGGTNTTVFELSQSGGQWNETLLHSFTGSTDGVSPSKLAFDAKGNLYGTTRLGGSGCNAPGCGIVFELSPQSGSVWKEAILHQFESASDGSQSDAGVLLDNANQRLFGVTQYGGGRYGYGTAFEIEK